MTRSLGLGLMIWGLGLGLTTRGLGLMSSGLVNNTDFELPRFKVGAVMLRLPGLLNLTRNV